MRRSLHDNSQLIDRTMRLHQTSDVEHEEDQLTYFQQRYSIGTIGSRSFPGSHES